MSICVFARISRHAGGLFYAVRSLCKALQSNGASFLVYGSNDAVVGDDIASWTPVQVVPYRTFGPLASSFKLRRMLSSHPPDLIHVHGLWLADQWTALRWQRKTGKPVVISPHGMLDPWAIRNSAWKKRLVGRLFANESLRKATCVHALCQSELESIRAYGLDNPVAVIPNGVELPELGERKSEVGSRRSDDDGRKQLLFLGRIHPKKGLVELLQAWGMEQGTWRQDWKLLIAGWDDGNHLAGLKQQASRAGLSWSDETPSSDLRSPTSVLRPLSSDLCPPSSDLCFIGPKFGEEKDALLRDVDAFILPSFSEGLPMSVLEAWSYGLPVVMTDYCNIPDGFAEAAALRIEPDADSIAQGLAQLGAMSDADLDGMGAKGRELVERQFTWERIAQDMKAVYEWCLGGDKPPCIHER